MEPMTLGSPVNGYIGSAQGSGNNPGGNQGYLPGYLIGDQYSSPQSQINSSIHLNQSVNQLSASLSGSGGSHRLTSPSKLNRSLSAQNSSTPNTPSLGGFQQQRSIIGNNNNFVTPSGRHGGGTAGGKTPGGPPVTGLFSTINSVANKSITHEVNQSPYGTPNRLGGTPLGPSTPMPSTPHLSFGATPSRCKEEIPFNNTGTELSSWITVFGFPPTAASYILSQFSQYGVVLQHNAPLNGNWINVRYQTKIQAQKAISKSGKILGGSIMIGVVPCTDPSIIDDQDENKHPANTSVLDSSNIFDNSQLNSSSIANRSSIRPLTQAYKLANTDHEVLVNSNTPDKNSGFVNKAMEYIFGW